jgi:cyclophilin family peptidyl-prolyl cis-trans isomerase
MVAFMSVLFLLGWIVAQGAPAKALFQTPYAMAEMVGKQAVLETDAGTVVIELLPAKAPNHVGHFMKLARDGAYDGTIFHRVIRYGIVQGGDPLSRDPAKAQAYGTGGLNELKAEFSDEPTTAGAVAGVLVPNQPDSAGAQFFICATDQPSLQGQYTVFGRVVEGLEVVQAISASEADAEGRPKARITIRTVTIRDTPPVPFVNDTPAELRAWRATLETTMGAIELEMLANLAPETVRNFLGLAEAGAYDGVLVHRVAANFVIQTGALAYRDKPLTSRQQGLVHTLQPEFSDTPNLPGIVSMARGEDPASASTSFFICTGNCRSLDGQYTVFARVSSGMDVLNAIAAVPVDGETPRTPIVVTRVVLERAPGGAGFFAHAAAPTSFRLADEQRGSLRSDEAVHTRAKQSHRTTTGFGLPQERHGPRHDFACIVGRRAGVAARDGREVVVAHLDRHRPRDQALALQPRAVFARHAGNFLPDAVGIDEVLGVRALARRGLGRAVRLHRPVVLPGGQPLQPVGHAADRRAKDGRVGGPDVDETFDAAIAEPRGGDRADAPERIDGQLLQERFDTFGRDHREPVGLPPGRRDLGEELVRCDAG